MTFVLYCFIVHVCIPSFAQQLPFSQLTISDGLEDMVIFDMEQDNQGFLWFTTRTGVNRFDGNQFWTFNKVDGLPHYLVRDLEQSKSGVLWAASEAGVSWFDGTQFHAFPPEIWPRTISARMVKEAPNGDIWVATYGMGLVHIKPYPTPKIVKVYNKESKFPNDYIRSLMVDDLGQVWAGDSHQVIKIANDIVTTYPLQTKASEIRALLQYSDEVILAATRHGVVQFNGSVFEPAQFDLDLSNQTINNITVDSEENIWISSRDNGAYQFNSKYQLIQHLNMSNGLPDHSVNTIIQDNEFNLWLATYGGGVARLSEANVVNWKAQSEMPNPNISAITQDNNGCIWIGSNGDGVSLMCDEVLSHYTIEDGLSHNKVLTAAIDADGNPWFGTLSGVTYIKEGNFHILDSSNGLPASVIYHIIRTKDGSMWLGTDAGLLHHKEGAFITYTTSNGLPNNRINRMLENQDGNIWLASSNGLSLFENGEFTNWSIEDGLAANFINDIYEDKDGLLWLATADGLSVFDGNNFNTWTTKDGLPHNNASTILPGENGEIWIGTSRGVAIFDGINFTVITSREGLVFDLVNRGAGLKDPENNLWFGTGDGISKFAANFKPGSSQPPPIYLLSVRDESNLIDLASNNSINESESNLTFNYTAINYQRSRDVSYRYRLQSNSDSNWRETKLKQIQINSLAAGDYIFQVTARVGNGSWNPVPAQFNFVVTPPFWKTPLFLMMILALFIAAWIYRSWRSRIHAHQLEELVQERTQQLEEVNRGLDWMANHDSLTRLANRHHVQHVLKKFNNVKSLTPFGVIVIDIDHFKTINDRFGHSVGDATLQLFSAMLKKLINPKHTVARWGGEEFLIISPKTQLEKLTNTVEGIIEQSRRLIIPTGLKQTTQLRCSIGFVHLNQLNSQSDITNQMEQCIQLADKALYTAKSNGRDQFCGYIVNYPLGELTLKDYIGDPAESIENNWIEVID